ncbi:type II toxin-antitoxin system HicB family antitoxin [Dyadobacter sp. OTU695]|uniref:type II toxin-antitoxin system HicB family antitoxin n=1 Tax=Dyadobacter sp. OTU695 TaxID=3043860 RepID=UPI00313A9169
MSKPQIVMDIVKEDEGYSAVADIAGRLIGTQGDTLEELKENILEAVNLAFSEDDFRYTIDEIELRGVSANAAQNSLH